MLVGWDEDTSGEVDHPILSNRILQYDWDIPVQFHLGEASKPGNIDGDILLGQQGGYVEVIMTMTNIVMSLTVSAGIVCVAVNDLIRNNVVLEDGLQITESFLGIEKESICSWTQFLEGRVVWGEDGGASKLDTVDEAGKVGLVVG